MAREKSTYGKILEQSSERVMPKVEEVVHITYLLAKITRHSFGSKSSKKRVEYTVLWDKFTN